MSWKSILKFAPLVLPLLTAAATPMIDSIRQWVIDHPTQTILTSAFAAIANWLVPSPFQGVDARQKQTRVNQAR